VDGDLIEAARNGDRDAYVDLISVRQDRLFATAQRILRDIDRAEDALQDALVIAWRDLRGLRDPDRFDAWLQRLLINVCISQATRERRRTTKLRVLPVDGPAEGHGHDAQIDSKGRIVIGNDDNGKVVFLDADGTVLDSFDADACNVTSDAARNLYVGGCGSDQLTIFNESHQAIGSSSDPVLRATPRFGPNGEIFAIDRNGDILKLAVNLPD
jgi:DNA-directed RNA polymerase specialized sigma24 family protein